MSELQLPFDWPASTQSDPMDRPELRLHAVSTRPTAELLPLLTDAIDRACGWVLHRQMINAFVLQIQLETQGRTLVDIYAALVEQGLELSRDSHMLLTERCSCAHMSRYTRSAIIMLSLEVELPPELPVANEWWRIQPA